MGSFYYQYLIHAALPTGWCAYPAMQILFGDGIQEPDGQLTRMMADACVAACVAIGMECFSLDYNVDFGTCHLHTSTSGTNCDPLLVHDQVYHAARDPCPGKSAQYNRSPEM